MNQSDITGATERTALVPRRPTLLPPGEQVPHQTDGEPVNPKDLSFDLPRVMQQSCLHQIVEINNPPLKSGLAYYIPGRPQGMSLVQHAHLGKEKPSRVIQISPGKCLVIRTELYSQQITETFPPPHGYANLLSVSSHHPCLHFLHPSAASRGSSAHKRGGTRSFATICS